MKIIEKIRYLKQIKEEKELNQIVSKLPENETVCKEILRQMNKEGVAVEKSKIENSNTSLYLVQSNKIIIGNLEENFIRIQTIAHECVHSIQNRKKLKFHFWFSNFLQIAFLGILIAVIALQQDSIQWGLELIYLWASFILFQVRYSLEKDAMTRAKDFAMNYIRKSKRIDSQEAEKIEKEYETINQIGIPIYGWYLGTQIVIKNLLIMTLILVF